MSNILTQYDTESPLYASYTNKVKELLEEMLKQHNISVHSVTCRVKGRDSLEKKLKKPGNHYLYLRDITDISGIRITTYFDDDVEKVARILENEFIIDKENSADKKKLLDPDRFGYLSMHHVVSLTNNRCKLIEYKNFSGLKAEIQTRSILQHAWAEIEHDLGYKSKQGVPENIRRRFSRLAGLFELADQEFSAIRNELIDYVASISDNIEQNPHNVPIDADTLSAFINSNGTLKDVERKISRKTGLHITDFYQDSFDDEDIARLKYFNLNAIAEVEQALQKHAAKIVRFCDNWVNRNTDEEEFTAYSFIAGISLFYLCYVLAASSNDFSTVEDYVTNHINIRAGESYKKLAEEVVRVYKAC